MFKKISKIFFVLTMVLAILILALLLIHAYLGDRHFDSGRHFFPPESQFLQPDAREFSVAIMGDSTTNNLVLENVILDARNSDANYSFILYLGDFVMDRSRTNFYWMLWEIGPKLGDLPLYMIPGNHDVAKYGNVDKSFYQSVMGATYYWFGYGDTLFVGIDSSGDYMEDEQFKWLSDTLTKIRPMFRHCIIFGHRPPVNPPNRAAHKMDDVSAEKLKNIVRKHKIDAMFFGHVHYWSEYTFAGIPIYTIPSAGQYFGDDIKKYGYVDLKVGHRGIENIEPKYIEFTGHPREQLEAWLTSNILSQKLRKMLSILFISAGFFMGVGFGVNYLRRKSVFRKIRRHRMRPHV